MTAIVIGLLLFLPAAESGADDGLRPHFRIIKTHLIPGEPVLAETGFENVGSHDITIQLGLANTVFEWHGPKGPWAPCTWQSPQFQDFTGAGTTVLKPKERHVDVLEIYHECKEIMDARHFWIRQRLTRHAPKEPIVSKEFEVVFTEPKDGDRSILVGYQLCDITPDFGPLAAPSRSLSDLLQGAPMPSGDRPKALAYAQSARDFVKQHPEFMCNEQIQYSSALQLTKTAEYGDARTIARKLSRTAKQPRIKAASGQLLEIIDRLEYVVKPKWI